MFLIIIKIRVSVPSVVYTFFFVARCSRFGIFSFFFFLSPVLHVKKNLGIYLLAPNLPSIVLSLSLSLSHTHTHTYTHAHTQSYIHTNTNTHTNTHKHTHTNTHKHTHKHTQIRNNYCFSTTTKVKPTRLSILITR